MGASVIEMKSKTRGHFVDINEDKFTKTRIVKAKKEIEWNDDVLKESISLDGRNHMLKLQIDYRHKDRADSVFFEFTYFNIDGGYPGMDKLIVYLILDSNQTIEFNYVIGFERYSETQNNGDSHYNVYAEKAQFIVPMSDMISIANAEKIEYSIRFETGRVEGVFPDSTMMIIKGFYNNTFDEDFQVDYLYEAINTVKLQQADPAKRGCYIATMVYGNYDHPKVQALRQFRDQILLKSWMGKKFVSIYYSYSPILVKKLENHERINKSIRQLLDVFINLIKNKQNRQSRSAAGMEK